MPGAHWGLWGTCWLSKALDGNLSKMHHVFFFKFSWRQDMVGVGLFFQLFWFKIWLSFSLLNALSNLNFRNNFPSLFHTYVCTHIYVCMHTCVCLCVFEAGFHVPQAYLTHPVSKEDHYPLILTPSLPSTGITGLCHHDWLLAFSLRCCWGLSSE